MVLPWGHPISSRPLHFVSGKSSQTWGYSLFFLPSCAG